MEVMGDDGSSTEGYSSDGEGSMKSQDTLQKRTINQVDTTEDCYQTKRQNIDGGEDGDYWTRIKGRILCVYSRYFFHPVGPSLATTKVSVSKRPPPPSAPKWPLLTQLYFFYIGSFLRQQRTRKFTNTDINFPDSQPPRRNDIVGPRIPPPHPT